MNRSVWLSTSACIFVPLLSAQEPYRPPVVGRWDLTLTASDGRRLPSWLEVQVSGNHVLVGRYVSVVGSARPVSRMEFAHDTLRFSIPSQWESGPNDLQLEAVLAGNALSGAAIMPDGTRLPLTGVRAPALHGTRIVQWARPVRLLKGVDLAGWHPLPGGESAWQMVAGVLTNAKAGANLATDASYGDFKLHVEFRYPTGGNSGIYLRGRYEVQIEDPSLGVVATEGLGAIYGFIAPNEQAAKAAGEWNSYDITLVGRLLTVVLNGLEVIARQNTPGPTGGALDSDEGKPGPIFLQGDHGPIEYRNITIAVGH